MNILGGGLEVMGGTIRAPKKAFQMIQTTTKNNTFEMASLEHPRGGVEGSLDSWGGPHELKKKLSKWSKRQQKTTLPNSEPSNGRDQRGRDQQWTGPPVTDAFFYIFFGFFIFFWCFFYIFWCFLMFFWGFWKSTPRLFWSATRGY